MHLFTKSSICDYQLFNSRETQRNPKNPKESTNLIQYIEFLWGFLGFLEVKRHADFDPVNHQSLMEISRMPI